MNIYIITGSPGAGKTTQAELLASTYGLIHINYRKFLKKEIDERSYWGSKAYQYTKDDKEVPDFLVTKMIGVVIGQNPKVNGFVLDGFPTSVEGAATLEQFLKVRSLRVQYVFYLDCLYDVLAARSQEKGNLIDEIQMDRNVEIHDKILNYKTKQQQILSFYQYKHEFKRIEGNTPDPKIVFNEIQLIIKGMRQ